MPNPIAHPAAAMPFTRAGLVLSALMIGSVSPDFGYFIPAFHGYFMYTAPGLILFDVPVGFALLWLFQTFMKWPLLSAAPDGLQRRLLKPAQGFSFGPLKRFGLILLSLLVGSLTHVIWDSFTHEQGWMVQQFSFLSTSIAGTPLYRILQDVGTVLGTCVLVTWFIRWLPTAPLSDQLPARFSSKVRTLFLALVTISLAAAEGATIYASFGPGARLVRGDDLSHYLTLAAVLVVSFYVGAYCLAWMVAFRKTSRGPG